MPLSIRTNVASLSAVSSLTKTQSSLSKSIGRISTGLKHSGFADGASEMAFGQKLQTDQVSLKAAMSNTSQGISLLSVGEDGLNQVYNALNKMREIAVAANNGTASSSDRATYAAEFDDGVVVPITTLPPSGCRLKLCLTALSFPLVT